MGDVLSAKEGKELKPRLCDALAVVFKYTDKGIEYTTKNNVGEIYIWSSIDKSEIEVIATFILERAQKNRLIANGVRRIASDYSKLQLGIILLPRFIFSAQNYIQNGFKLPFGGNQ